MNRIRLVPFAAATLVGICSAMAQQVPPPVSAPPAPPAPTAAERHAQQEMRLTRKYTNAAPGSFVLRAGSDTLDPLGSMPGGMWWKNTDTIQKINLTPDQQKRIDDTFRQNRLQLIDLKASLEKEQINLEPILNAPTLDNNRALAEISKIADLRAELEKSHARMLLGIRGILTTDQWTKLQSDYRERRMHVFGPAGFTIPAIDIPEMNVEGFKTRGIHMPARTLPPIEIPDLRVSMLEDLAGDEDFDFSSF